MPSTATSPTTPASSPHCGAMFPQPRANRILASLDTEELQRWLPALRPVQLVRGQTLSLQQAFFPTTAMVSLLSSSSSGDRTEVAMVGSEGMIGVALLTEGGPPVSQAEVTSSGHAYALPGTILREEFFRSGRTMQVLLRYLQALMSQTVQQAVCVQRHSVEQRVCRCLLDSFDRKGLAPTLALTHESIGLRLGVRRETVTACAKRLQDMGAISYRVGVITVHDRDVLRACSCDCYRTLRQAYDRLLPVPSLLEPWDPKPPVQSSSRSVPPAAAPLATLIANGAAQRAMQPPSARPAVPA